MTSAAPHPQVNFPVAGGVTDSDGQRRSQHFCVVCADESDGLHFGQFTCRACAAFFRRTVSLKLQYTCKRDHNCEVDKAARNMCRACRYQKCIGRGMLTSAVQHARDGIGKRAKSAHQQQQKMSPDSKVAKPGAGDGLGAVVGSPSSSSSAVVSSSSGPFPAQSTSGGGHSFVGIHHQQAPHFYSSQSPSLLEQTLLHLNASSASSMLGQSQQQQQHYAVSSAGDAGQQQSVSPYSSFMGSRFPGLLGTQQQQQFSPSAATAPQPQQQPSTSSAFVQPELKYLSRMLEGYQHFLSLRKASYTLVEGFPLDKRDNEDCPQSNFGTSKKICKIEASLIMDTVEKFFQPFNQLPTEDKHKMFDPFYCLFSNAERAFRTYKMFGADDDRLLMPDGGYVRLSELQKFYENNTLVRGDPSQVAKIFENAMQYLVRTVVVHMRNIELAEMELMALFGMFIWSDSEDIAAESLQLAQRVRNEIIVDLHLYYRGQGLSEAEITVRTANLFLLIPKLENAVRLVCENFHVASVFNMMDISNCNQGTARVGTIKDRKTLFEKCC